MPLPDWTRKFEKIGWVASVLAMRSGSVRARSRRLLTSSSSVVRQSCIGGTLMSLVDGFMNSSRAFAYHIGPTNDKDETFTKPVFKDVPCGITRNMGERT